LRKDLVHDAVRANEDHLLTPQDGGWLSADDA
jgi:hypothetical protein